MSNSSFCSEESAAAPATCCWPAAVASAPAIRARRRDPGGTLSSIVTGKFADQRTGGAAQRAPGASTLAGRRGLLLPSHGLFLGRLDLFGRFEWIDPGIAHRPLVATGLVRGLLAGALPLLWKRIYVQRRSERLFRLFGAGDAGYHVQDSETCMDFRFRFQRIDGASHWLMLDRQASVNRAVLDWLTAD